MDEQTGWDYLLAVLWLAIIYMMIAEPGRRKPQ